MEDPLEELKRFIMNDGNTETNSWSMVMLKNVFLLICKI